jgi:hypothetical protein
LHVNSDEFGVVVFASTRLSADDQFPRCPPRDFCVGWLADRRRKAGGLLKFEETHAPTTMTMTTTTTTVEIAKLTGKQHRNVLADARNMLEAMGDGGVLRFQQAFPDAYGQAPRGCPSG